MTGSRNLFLATMAERRKHKLGSLMHAAMTRAARKYVWMMRGVPTCDWPVER